MKEFIHAIEAADIESIELWLSENASQTINKLWPVSSRITHYSKDTAEIYPLVLAWQLIFSSSFSEEKFSEKHFMVFKKLAEMGADFECLKAYQNNKVQQQRYPYEQPLLYQLCERYIENLERDEEEAPNNFLRFHFLIRGETDFHTKQQRREYIILLIKILLAKGFDINETNSQGHSILPNMLRHGCLELVDFFLGNNANIHYVTPDGSTALHHFMEGAKYFDEPLSFLKQLPERGMDVNISNDRGETPFSQLLTRAPEKLIAFFPMLLHYGLQLNTTLNLWQREQMYAELVQHNPDNFLFLIKQGMLVTPEIYLTVLSNHQDHQVLQDYMFEQANIAKVISANTGDNALH